MKEFLLVISMWGYDGAQWIYKGNQYVMKELLTQRQCERIIERNNWDIHAENSNYKIQFDCFHKDAR